MKLSEAVASGSRLHVTDAEGFEPPLSGFGDLRTTVIRGICEREGNASDGYMHSWPSCSSLPKIWLFVNGTQLFVMLRIAGPDQFAGAGVEPA